MLGYFGARFDRLLGGNFHVNLATPLAQLAITAAMARPNRCNLGGLVTVTTGSGRPTHGPWPTPVAMLQIAFIHSVSAIGTWMVQKKFEIATLADFVCCS